MIIFFKLKFEKLQIVHELWAWCDLSVLSKLCPFFLSYFPQIFLFFFMCVNLQVLALLSIDGIVPSVSLAA